MQYQHYLPPFQFDYRPAPIRSQNYERFIPTKPLTDKAIEKYGLLGKYGPDEQKRLLAKAGAKTKVKKLRVAQHKKITKILSAMDY